MSDITALRTGPIAVNTYFIPLGANDCGGRVVVVDPAGSSFSGDEDAIVSHLKLKGLTLAGIALTHGHFDHILGIAPLVKAFGALPVAAAEEDAAALTDASLAFHRLSLEMMGEDSRLERALEDVVECDKRVMPYEGETLLDAFCKKGGKAAEESTKDAADGIFDAQERKVLSEWQVIATPGHTMGSVCLYNKDAGEILTGDTMFYHGWGRTDLGGSEMRIMQSLRLLRKRIPPATLTYPGHERYGFAIGDNF